ncbi:alpha-N-acetylglucosaminidase [Niabella pedocola]|uniref:Alpha-N-acetylglucosaminidase n=1 Tax=Niabella pedocola TaxID=1752077 RepID=A0ABS8PJT9_9BACT|nr:alpha-N-acetylglucosaminidase [Niabella pedocola]MCD2421246.1 alpha-N-acetylglucosaminidase [Niabella pedocola]
MPFKLKILILVVLNITVVSFVTAQDLDQQAAERLIRRVVPAHVQQFKVTAIPADNGKDVFEIESDNGRVVLRGNNTVSVASALNWYLKYFCHVQRSWCGNQMRLPARLPVVSQKVRQVTPYAKRSYLNYCTFNYSMSWWSWERWEQEIDWMAMHGINMPLAITGQEAVWQNTLRRFGMSDEEIRAFLVGPAYQAWQWMTNIESVYGPLPQQWINRSIVLGKKILERERELGMTPVLQGFTGYVPVALKKRQPQADIIEKPIWFFVGGSTAQLNPIDPLFSEMTKAFIEEQTKLFGTNHIYAADPFHEGKPPVSGDDYLTAVGKKIYEATTAVDPRAVIAMQTWSMRKPIVEAIPSDRIIMLDLNSQKWKGSEAFWGRPWLAGIIHNFGGNTAMGGNLNEVLARFPRLLSHKEETRNLSGIGMFPEAIGHNPVIYEAASEMAWHPEQPDTQQWLYGYLRARYGQLEPAVQQAWDLLLQTIYSAQTGVETFRESAICARPALTVYGASPNGALNSQKNYSFASLWTAVKLLTKAGTATKNADTYKYDLVDVMRQCLADLAIPIQARMGKAYSNNKQDSFAFYSQQFLDLMSDFDVLLGTREEFLLGKWLSDARAIGETTAEKDLYEKNARGLITIWGPYDSSAIQYDYSARQWNGLVRTFYKPRWEKFITMLNSEFKKQPDQRYQEVNINHRFRRPRNNANDFYRMISRWESDWVTRPGLITQTRPSGNELRTVLQFYNKWYPVAQAVYR